MFGKTTLLTTITLAIFASALPAEVNTGISIPLHKRGSLTRDDGVFDLSKAVLATVKVKNKYRQNMISLVRNGGSLPGGARILPVPAKAISKRQQENMTERFDAEWGGDVTIGSNNQRFLINFDSELSSHFPLQWLPTLIRSVNLQSPPSRCVAWNN